MFSLSALHSHLNVLVLESSSLLLLNDLFVPICNVYT